MIISKGGLLKTYKTPGEGRWELGLPMGTMAASRLNRFQIQQPQTAPNKSGFWVLNIMRWSLFLLFDPWLKLQTNRSVIDLEI